MPPGYGPPAGPGGAPSWYGPIPQLAPPTGNSTATAALVFGICSALLPVLSIPGIVLGARSLRRIKQNPSVRGRGRSIAGIVTSAVLGPLALLGVVVFAIGAVNAQMNMPRLQTGIASLLDAQIKQHDGYSPSLTVQCPSSEPRQSGTEFSCSVLVAHSSARFTTQIRVTDSEGDYLVESFQQVSPPSAPSSVPTTVPPAPPLVHAATPDSPAVLTGTPSNGQMAVIRVDVTGRRLLLDTGANDVTYTACSGFHAVAPGGAPMGLSGLSAGDYLTATIDANAPCVSAVTLLTPPAPPQCTSSGFLGSAVVTWEGFNQGSHAVLYQPTGPGEPIVADRWCTTPSLGGANGAAVTLSQIPKGAQVQLLTSDAGWLNSVLVKS